MNSPLPPAAGSQAPDPVPTPRRSASTRRRRKATGALVIAAGLLGAGAVATAVVPEPQVATAQQDQAALIAEGKSIYDVACITCHGQTSRVSRTAAVARGCRCRFRLLPGPLRPHARGGQRAQAERKKPRWQTPDRRAGGYVDQYGGGRASSPTRTAPSPGACAAPPVEPRRGAGPWWRALPPQLRLLPQLHRSWRCALRGQVRPILDPASGRRSTRPCSPARRTCPSSRIVSSRLTRRRTSSPTSRMRTQGLARRLRPGRLGPVTEGAAIWLVGIVALIGATLWIGSRS